MPARVELLKFAKLMSSCVGLINLGKLGDSTFPDGPSRCGLSGQIHGKTQGTADRRDDGRVGVRGRESRIEFRRV